MNTVQIIKISKKGKLYIVFTTVDEDGIDFTEDQIVNHRIIKGACYQYDEWIAIKKTQNNGLLFDKALRYIDYKPRTTQEMVEYLKKLDADEQNIQEIINRLIQINYLDDKRYVNIYVEESIRNFKGPEFIKFALEQKGIPINLINEALLEYNNSTMEHNALIISQKYLRTINQYPTKKQKELLSQKLQRSGFHYQLIKEVVNKISWGMDDLNKLASDYQKISSKTSDQQKIINNLLQKGYQYEDIKKIKNNQ